MADPLTASAITTLIFTTAVAALTEALTEGAREKVTEKLKALKQLIANKFKSHTKAQVALDGAGQGTKADIEKVASYLEVAMDNDEAFAQQIQSIAEEIQQQIDIGQIQGKNIQNVYGGEATQINDVNAPIIQGVSGGTININYGAPSDT